MAHQWMGAPYEDFVPQSVANAPSGVFSQLSSQAPSATLFSELSLDSQFNKVNAHAPQSMAMMSALNEKHESKVRDMALENRTIHAAQSISIA
ncbi:MAG: hypothetical protein ACYYK0_02385 [Candidatus Eutrophobiaceae bacterium]